MHDARTVQLHSQVRIVRQILTKRVAGFVVCGSFVLCPFERTNSAGLLHIEDPQPIEVTVITRPRIADDDQLVGVIAFQIRNRWYATESDEGATRRLPVATCVCSASALVDSPAIALFARS